MRADSTFGDADARVGMQYLSLQVAAIHHVIVCQHQSADTGCGQIVGGR
jgi:hypothetical protein